MELYLKDTQELKEFDGIILPLFEEETVINGIEIDLEYLSETKKFSRKFDKTYHLNFQSPSWKEVILVGLGKQSELTYRKLLKAIGTGYRALKKEKVENGAFVLNLTKIGEGISSDESPIEFKKEDIVKAVVEALNMSDYVFDDYKTKEDETEDIIMSVVIENSDSYEGIAREASSLAYSNVTTRDLVNQPSNVLTPEVLAKEAVDLGQENGFDVEVLNLEAIKELEMKAYLSVAKGSDNEPKLIVMRYNGRPDSKERLGFVGKGLTYDSGGLSIKPTTSMVTMKSDMGGAAAVIGALSSIAREELPVNITAVVAACENMISGSCYRPGDIIGSMAGKSIYIGNTDAEGRLTLIDALHYIVTKEEVTKVVDIATLTGSVTHCLGTVATGAITTNQEFYKQVEKSFDLSGELIWQMPVFDEYKEMVKHKEADLTNIAGRPGMITAGVFLGEFTGKLPWVHLDIAGSSWTDKTEGVISKGGTGAGAKPLYYLAKLESEK